MSSSYLGAFSSSFTTFRSASSWFEVYAAFSTFMMLLRTAINDLVPEKARSFITSKLESFFSKFQEIRQVSLKIERNWGDNNGERNELYHAVHKYLPTRITNSYKSLKVGKLSNHNNLDFAVDESKEVVDEFEGTRFTWMHSDESDKERSNPDRYTFTLSFNEKDKKLVIDRYIPHVLKTYEIMQAEQRILKIYSNSGGYWNESELSHPATFDTIALDPELKRTIIDDLDRFLGRKDFYKKVGKPWKRGYLLYGPPGTGKSSLIAAMANYLKFDVYDLQLSSIYSNENLNRVMRETSPRSIIVIEDIDCNSEVQPRSTSHREDAEEPGFYTDSDEENKEPIAVSKFTLSGLLNSVDGLWSSYGEERIIIFTTNHQEKIDPALLRPGRMDMHINLSFLKAKAFRILASNYLDIEDHHHPLLGQIDELLEETEVTPAVVAEQLMRCEDANVALDELVKFLKEIDMKGKANLPAEN